MTALASKAVARSMHANNWRRVITLISVTLWLSVATYAQGESQFKDALRMKKPPLKFKLVALTPTACVGVPLKLRLEVTNVGQEKLRVNGAYFWNTRLTHLSTEESKGDDKEFSYFHSWPRSTTEDIFFLPPGKTYVIHTYWSLDEEAAGHGPGNYTLELRTYGTRNKVQLELLDCKTEKLRSKNEHKR